VAILIEDYDAPILSARAQPELADQITKLLQKFYVVIKDVEEYRGLTFFTGVTERSGTTIFFEVNNVMDLTFHDDFDSICGFTCAELDTFFQGRLEQALIELKTSNQLTPGATMADLREIILERCEGLVMEDQTRVLNPSALFNIFGQGGVK
jgi:hypothetical protein